MIKFDLDEAFEMATEFIYDDENKNSPLANDVEYLFEFLSGMREEYTYEEVARVVNSLSVLIYDDDDLAELKKTLRGIKSEDIAWIAAHFGFLYGILFAINHKRF